MSAPIQHQTFEVDAMRLETGTWCHKRDKLIGEGDISASYSADTIALEGRVRKPFRWMNALWVCTNMLSDGGTLWAEAYRLLPQSHFDGTPATYQQIVTDGDTARNRTKGFYHGMSVTHGNKQFVLSGPSAVFVPSATEQLSLL